jgi:hypothetical protein
MRIRRCYGAAASTFESVSEISAIVHKIAHGLRRWLRLACRFRLVGRCSWRAVVRRMPLVITRLKSHAEPATLISTSSFRPIVANKLLRPCLRGFGGRRPMLPRRSEMIRFGFGGTKRRSICSFRPTNFMTKHRPGPCARSFSVRAFRFSPQSILEYSKRSSIAAKIGSTSKPCSNRAPLQAGKLQCTSPCCSVPMNRGSNDF